MHNHHLEGLSLADTLQKNVNVGVGPGSSLGIKNYLVIQPECLCCCYRCELRPIQLIDVVIDGDRCLLPRDVGDGVVQGRKGDA